MATVVGLVAQRMPDTRIMEEYPDLEIEDIRQSLRFAAAAVDERQLPLAKGAARPSSITVEALFELADRLDLTGHREQR